MHLFILRTTGYTDLTTALLLPNSKISVILDYHAFIEDERLIRYSKLKTAVLGCVVDKHCVSVFLY